MGRIDDDLVPRVDDAVESQSVDDEQFGDLHLVGVGDADQRLSVPNDMDDSAVFLGSRDNEGISCRPAGGGWRVGNTRGGGGLRAAPWSADVVTCIDGIVDIIA